ncbi:hypothetical protein O181_057349 [Austropuccinia psidii MF-1]|uniref:Uncharacterized protein n=1 Tax=Austropuccinia psidii MF-1 TaxID=1389203 RepID=A0A9Q3EAA4_9BASI|nr:hypothetical protein [Austropuccinia psidii MF-1]
MHDGMTPYTFPGSLLFFENPSDCPGSQRFTCKFLCLSRIPMLHLQKPCAGEAFQKCQQFLMLVQAPNACTGSQKFKQLHIPRQPPATPTLPYASEGSQFFTHKSLHLYRFLKIQKIPYTAEAF